jgi:formate hydrogenlyase subunit 6/NADH:ubiquinone oxidoreductase subunit I
MTYFKDIRAGIKTTLKGLSLTLRHIRNATKRRTPEGVASENYFDLQNGLVTLQYPHEQLPIPDNGRYRLRNEIDDCIVCDKCAKVCPVDCITIDAIKATEEVGRASDGSPIRLYAAKFDIDMAKCCYCGLCTVVCPTECLTMDKKFDYSEFELGALTYHFSELTPEQADEKRSLYEQFLQEKEAAKIAAKAQAVAKSSEPTQPTSDIESPAKPAVSSPRPVFRPMAKPAAKTPSPEPANSEGSAIRHPLTDATPEEMQHIAQGGLEITKHPVFEPAQRPTTRLTDVPPDAQKEEQTAASEPPVTPKPSAPPKAFRPSMKPNAAESPKPPATEANAGSESSQESSSPKPSVKPAGFRPTMKPPVKEPDQPDATVEADVPKPKPAFKPTMKPAATKSNESSALEIPKPASGFRPTMKPAIAELDAPSNPETPEPAGFRPTMKPAVTKPEEPINDTSAKPEPPKPKPAAFRPTMKPPKPTEQSEPTDEPIIPDTPKPKPAAFRPTMKPAATPKQPDVVNPEQETKLVSEKDDSKQPEAPIEEPVKPAKPAFRPTMKPKAKPDDDTSA